MKINKDEMNTFSTKKNDLTLINLINDVLLPYFEFNLNKTNIF